LSERKRNAHVVAAEGGKQQLLLTISVRAPQRWITFLRRSLVHIGRTIGIEGQRLDQCL